MKCGTSFGFDPKLATGDLLAGQYEVVGCLAHGGLGWVYLAIDRKVEDRWVVLKGMLDSGDRDATAAALTERRFLAKVEHPNIVEIYNFSEHCGAGYIVMEYVDGRSLRDVLRHRREENDGIPSPLPVEEAVAYVLELLPAIGYLHGRGLAFCDFKPDNIIRTDTSVKLIDLGGVYRIDDDSSPIYGTVGFQAPEIAETGPTIASDIYTIGRTLAVLCTDFVGYHTEFRFSLPDPGSVPLYAEFDSFRRLIDRATAADPDERFQSAEEMSTQLVGVLREIVAARSGTPSPGPSTLFAPSGRVTTSRPAGAALPRLVIDPGDPGAGVILGLRNVEPEEVLRALDAHDQRSPEIDLWRARTTIELGRLDEAEQILADVERDDPWAWQVWWYRGVIALERNSGVAARRQFAVVYTTLPGELAPKIALAFSNEMSGDLVQAAALYLIVARTDPAFTVASFGLARCRAVLGDRSGAVDALAAVPETSGSHKVASAKAVGLLVSAPDAAVTREDVVRAAAIVDRSGLELDELDELRAPVLEGALTIMQRESQGAVEASGPGGQILGVEWSDDALRLELESTYRSLAAHAPTKAARIVLVDRANAVRPRSLW